MDTRRYKAQEMATSVAVHTYDPRAVGTYEFSLAEVETHCFPPENPFVSMVMLSSLVQFLCLLFMDSFIELFFSLKNFIGFLFILN